MTPYASATTTKALLRALKELSAMYTHAWDRVDGGLLMFGDSVQRFERAHADAEKAIKRAEAELSKT